MLVEQGGKKYHVTWQYLGEPRSVTLCLVSEIQPDGTKKFLSTGDAVCSAKDEFVKNSGRKISLGRALLVAVPTVEQPTEENPQKWEKLFSKETRIHFWSEYFLMHGKVE